MASPRFFPTSWHPTFKLTQPLAGIFDFSSFKLLSITKSNGQPLLLEDQTLYQCGGNPVPCQSYNQLRLSQAWMTEGDKASLELKFAEDLLPQENFTVKYVLSLKDQAGILAAAADASVAATWQVQLAWIISSV